ncbi:MAG: metallophosphoesterase [Syntrophobacteraceae bacterium]
MKIHLLSDIHNEFEIYSPPAVDADVVILAGDIDVKGRSIDWIERMFAGKVVLFVLGNHDFYGEAIPRQVEKAKERAVETTIHVLENGSFQLNDTEFFGCTFWTDFMLFGQWAVAASEAERQMTDYRNIRTTPGFKRLRAHDTAYFHSRSKAWLLKAVKESKCSRKVVITHHAPSALSLPPESALDIIDSAYTSNEDDLVAELGADLWVHGHIHHACDYRIGRTRIVNNPRGYPEEPAPGFDDSLVIEIRPD